MTRCYEFYVIYNKDKDTIVCQKPQKSKCQIEAYMTRMKEEYGIKFDGSTEDRAKFIATQADFPEYIVYRKNSVNTEKIIRTSTDQCGNLALQHCDICIKVESFEDAKTLWKNLGFDCIRDYLAKALERAISEDATKQP